MKYIASSLVLLSLMTLAGCGTKSDGNVFVTGTVTQGGQPLEGARVIFIPASGSGEGAGGKTDATGKFVLTTSTGKEGSGTKPGEYRVTVAKTKLEWDGKSYRTVSQDDKDVQVKDEKTIQLLPVQYGNFAQTPFKAAVTENKATNVFTFDIP
ncbi:MAG: carboxypeptidase-like regulatory domain-containing protein [Planctomycetaceae bacterium]|nr:carboxypeptidase-like regulatory domain-containing protein [Planctomycetaceae bacterium]